MVGTAGDFLKFLEALRTGGSPMTTNQSGGLGPVDPASLSRLRSLRHHRSRIGCNTPHSAGTFTWGGVYGSTRGSSIPRKPLLSVVALTNTSVEGVAGKFRADLREAIYASL